MVTWILITALFLYGTVQCAIDWINHPPDCLEDGNDGWYTIYALTTGGAAMLFAAYGVAVIWSPHV
jgi:hypothetical protein